MKHKQVNSWDWLLRLLRNSTRMVSWYEQFALRLFLWQQTDVADDADSVSSCGGSTEYCVHQQQRRQNNPTDKKIIKTGFKTPFLFHIFPVFNLQWRASQEIREESTSYSMMVRNHGVSCGVCACVCVFASLSPGNIARRQGSHGNPSTRALRCLIHTRYC